MNIVATDNDDMGRGKEKKNGMSISGSYPAVDVETWQNKVQSSAFKGNTRMSNKKGVKYRGKWEKRKGNERAITAFVFLGTAAQRYRVIIFNFKLSIDKKRETHKTRGFQKNNKRKWWGKDKVGIYMYLFQWNQYRNGRWPSGKMVFKREKKKKEIGGKCHCVSECESGNKMASVSTDISGGALSYAYIQKTTNTRNNHYASWLLDQSRDPFSQRFLFFSFSDCLIFLFFFFYLFFFLFFFFLISIS